MGDCSTVVIADDHPVFLAGLRQIVESNGEFAVVAEASRGVAALQAIQKNSPDLALLDLDLPDLNGIEIVRRLQEERHPTKLIMLTMHNTESLFHESLESGVNGYLLKDNAATDILAAMRTVLRGDTYICPTMSTHLVRRLKSSAKLSQRVPGLQDLTATERSILKLIATGKTSREIGRELFVSHRTVDTHRRNVCVKLGLRGTNKLVQFAIENRHQL